MCLPQKLKQDIARQKSCLEATHEMVTRFMEVADSPTASALQDKLAEATEHFSRLCRQQREREDALKSLLPKVEQYEQLSEKLQQFTESRARLLASGNQPDHDIAHFSQHIQVRCRGRRLCVHRVCGAGWVCSDFFPTEQLLVCSQAGRTCAGSLPGEGSAAGGAEAVSGSEKVKWHFPGARLVSGEGSLGRLVGARPNTARFYQLKAPWG